MNLPFGVKTASHSSPIHPELVQLFHSAATVISYYQQSTGYQTALLWIHILHAPMLDHFRDSIKQAPAWICRKQCKHRDMAIVFAASLT